MIETGGWDGAYGSTPDVPLHEIPDDAEHWGKLSVLDSLLLRLFSRDALAVLLGQETLAHKNRRLAIELHEARLSAPSQVLVPQIGRCRACSVDVWA